jgi:RND family efflux transporter MFP subunit
MTRRIRIFIAAGAGVVLLGAAAAVALVLHERGGDSASAAEAGSQEAAAAEAAGPGAQEHAHEHVAEQKTIYTCSMHPQIVQDEPGTCPVCGMDLVPKKVGGSGEPAADGPADTAKADGKGKIKYWVAPMDPTFISDKPGKSPMGMDLVPVYEDEAKSTGTTVSIDPVVVQNMGVRVATAERAPIARRVRTIGTVDVAESLVSVVNLRYSGWIERIFVNETGVKVRKGQRLFSVYSPELVSAQEEYLLAIRSSGKDSPLTRSARNRLAFWDLSNKQIAGIEARGKALRTLTVVAPRTGYVLHKNVVQGARVEAGHDLYRIGNLDKIWVNADVYEFDAPWVGLGDPATMELSFQQGKTYDGKVSFIHPTLNMKTRTLTVRLEFDNPGLQLKPGMFATVEIDSQRKADVLTVPTEAIIRSGTRQIVFVTPELGRYEVRKITTGLIGDDDATCSRPGCRRRRSEPRERAPKRRGRTPPARAVASPLPPQATGPAACTRAWCRTDRGRVRSAAWISPRRSARREP